MKEFTLYTFLASAIFLVVGALLADGGNYFYTAGTFGFLGLVLLAAFYIHQLK